jgi:hypothetical protein
VVTGEREREDACGRWRRWSSGTGEEVTRTGEEEAVGPPGGGRPHRGGGGRQLSVTMRESVVGNGESTGWRGDKVTVWETGVGAGRCMFYF